MDSVPVPDTEIADAARRRAGARSARVVSRTPFAAGGSGARFAHLVLEVDDVRRSGILKEIAPDPLGPTLERRFYEELAPRLPLRVPALLASGPLPGRSDGWIVLEPLPAPAGRGATKERFRALARDLGRAHAALLGAAPDWLPRPFGRDAAAWLAHVPAGVARLRERFARSPALRRLASEEVLDLAVALARDPGPIVRACARAPEAVIHRDLHHHNVSFGAEAVVFDWEAVCAGPAVFDVALLHAYQRNRALPLPGARWFAWRRPLVGWPELLGAHLDALAAHAAGTDRAALAAAAPAAFAWEAVHRLGWIDGQLDALAPLAAELARVPLLGALEGARPGGAMLRVWRALFASLPAHARALAAA
jgi:hypothetical protein